jgi:hypothetical protein
MFIFPERTPGLSFPLGGGGGEIPPHVDISGPPPPGVPGPELQRPADVPPTPERQLPSSGESPGLPPIAGVPDITAPPDRGRGPQYTDAPLPAIHAANVPDHPRDGSDEAADAGEPARAEDVSERRESTGDVLSVAETQERARAVEARVEKTRQLDPELLENAETRELVELGAEVGQKITDTYGTPDRPRAASGTHEEGVYMSYHNGGEDGHTSIGEQGAGVPRNVLLIAKAVNNAAGYEVYPVQERAKVLHAAWAHDSEQLCGRTLLPEGQGEGRGDERLTAAAAHDRLVQAGREDVADDVRDLIMTTAWNPQTSTQNIGYDRLAANPGNPVVLQQALNRELIGAADLLSPSSVRGPLGTIEYAVERMFLHSPAPQGIESQPAQRRLAELGIQVADIASMEQMMEVISGDPVLQSTFTKVLEGDPVFYADQLKYSDRLIRQACGQGIDDLFPLREANSSTLALHVLRLHSGRTPLDIWRLARAHAGY